MPPERTRLAEMGFISGRLVCLWNLPSTAVDAPAVVAASSVAASPAHDAFVLACFYEGNRDDHDGNPLWLGIGSYEDMARTDNGLQGRHFYLLSINAS